MSIGGFDQEIVQDFLTESGELLDQLEGDLVALEQTPTDPELLNQVFRALHTIKGSASFLALTNLVAIAHAAESALNAARNSLVIVDRTMMDLLLDAIDLLKKQFEELGEGQTDLTAPEPKLVDMLSQIGLGVQPVDAAAKVDSGQTDAAQPAQDSEAPTNNEPAQGASDDFPGAEIRSLDLPENKADLLEFLVADLDESIEKVQQQVDAMAVKEARDAAAEELAEISDSLEKSVDFFNFEPMSRLAKLLVQIAEHVSELDSDIMEQLLPRANGVTSLLRHQAKGLSQQLFVSWPLDSLVEAIENMLAGKALDDDQVLPKDASPEAALDLAGICPSKKAADQNTIEPPTAANATSPELTDNAPDAAQQEAAGTAKRGGAAIEQTIRVEVSRLESLMNLVGELVLQKNRIAAIGRQVDACSGVDQDLREAVTLSSGNLDRVTGDIQVAVMKTRMQPLDKIFGKYPRLIRDLAQKTGKKINLVIEGGDTEVDKSVIEELGDPLVHLLRNSADHGLEGPEERLGSGKNDTGTITLAASHEGSHVQVQIIDDGRGILRDKIAAKAIENGLASEGEISTMSDREVFRFILAAGFSTAEQVSDLSGRGVGMDVVRTNIEKLKGTIDVDSQAGNGSTITIKIPLTIAIMPAMMVGVAKETYAIPLSNILEIVKPEEEQMSTIRGQLVMRLRDTVLPLVNSFEVFNVSPPDRVDAPFAVVLELNEKRIGLMVSKLIGQQEIVVKPLDQMCDREGPISGATVRDDGGVSLIVDIAELIRSTETRQFQAEAVAA